MSITIGGLGWEYDAGVSEILDALGMGGDEVRLRLLNNIDLSTITNIFNTQYNSAYIKTCNFQSLKIAVCDECTVGGSVIIDQGVNVNLKLYLSTQSAFTAEVLTQLQQELQNQIVQALNKTETDLAAILGILSKSTTVDSDVENSIKRVIETTVTNQTVNSIVINSFSYQYLEVVCRAPVKGDLRVNQYSHQSAIVNSLINQVMTTVTSDQAIVDWANTINQDLTVTRIGPLAIFGIILMAIAIIAVIVLSIYLALSGSIRRAVTGRTSK